MQETSLPPDTGFVVEWQLADDAGTVIDLSAAESEVLLPADAELHSSLGLRPLT
jgi:hypothetical protein